MTDNSKTRVVVGMSGGLDYDNLRYYRCIGIAGIL